MATRTARPDIGTAPAGALSLQETIDAARPGDIVELAPGRYVRPVIIRAGGTDGEPVVVRGLPGATIDGGQVPHMTKETLIATDGHLRSPGWEDFAFFKLRNIESVIFETLVVASCWPSTIYAENCRHITLRASQITGGSFGLFARDDFAAGNRSFDFVIDGNRWVQDVTLWTSIEWSEAHHGAYAYLNGGLFGSRDIVGVVEFANNEVTDAFNGMRIDTSAELERDLVEIFKRSRNFNVHHNRFIRIRDNPVEPESYAVNWHVHHNLFVDCHACFSLDGVTGGYWYFYCNCGRFESAPGGIANRRGKIFKLDMVQPYPVAPVYVFNNSWQCRGAIIVGGEDDRFTTRLWTFANNAFEYCLPWDHAYSHGDAAVCPPGMPAIGQFVWHPSCRFDGDLTNNVQFFEIMRSFGEENRGILGREPLFDGAATNDVWPLAHDSPGRRRGLALDVALADGARWLLPAGLDVGAFDLKAPIEGPPFRLV